MRKLVFFKKPFSLSFLLPSTVEIDLDNFVFESIAFYSRSFWVSCGAYLVSIGKGDDLFHSFPTLHEDSFERP